MKKITQRIPFPIKLIIVGLLPLLFVLFLAVTVHRQQSDKITLLSGTMKRVDRSAAISQLVDALQLERRESFIHSITRRNEAMMVAERAKTDAALEKLRTVEGDQYRTLLQYSFLGKIDEQRSLMTRGSVLPMQVMSYYTNLIFRLNTISNLTISNIPYLNEANEAIISQRLLSELATYIGILRANVYYSLYTKSDSSAMGMTAIYEIYHSYITEYETRLGPEYRKQFAAVLSSSGFTQMENFLAESFRTGYFSLREDPEHWWQISGAAVDGVKSLQRKHLTLAQDTMSKIYEHEVETRERNLLLLILMIGLVIFIIALTIKSITYSLHMIKNAAGRIALGATDIALDHSQQDVIGDVARSIHEIDHNNKVLSKAAEAIGKGNFDIDVTPRSDEDVLGNAIAMMKKDLAAYTLLNERKLWVQTGLTEISEAIGGDRTVKEIALNAVDRIASYIKAELGLFYVSDNDRHLMYKASYAVNDKESLRTLIPFGEGQLGQAAIRQEVVSLSDIPEDFLKVSTASGQASVRHILIVPLVHNGKTEGVVELGSLKPFSEQILEFLDQAGTVIAVALQAAKAKQRLQEVLEETQVQAEELQSQHTELENLNTELEAQTQKLQASEEELRVQQEELIQTNQELEERSRLLEERNQIIEERNIEIQRKAEELELSTRYKSEFLANMSHELRTPLNSILLLSRLLTENNEKNLTEDQIEYARVIQTSGHGLLSLIDEILDLSKIEAGKMELEYGQYTINEILDDMRSLFSPIAKDKKLDLKVSADQNVPPVLETDKMRLEQILKNLMSNALKFTSEGRVSLEVISTGNMGEIGFRVSDTGIGIPREKHRQIFEAFQQADGSTRRKFGGTGLGLSISRELARLLGGEITIESEPGKGSRFTVTVPIRKPETVRPVAQEVPVVSEQPAAGPVPQPAGDLGIFKVTNIPPNIPDDREAIAPGDKSVLIIEDDTGFARALLDFSRSRGYKGIVTVRGDEGIELARKFLPVGILLDIQLPVKSGWEVMEALKGDPQTRHIPVHMMSSLQVKKESLMQGAVDFINKPVAFEQMQEVFRKIEDVVSKQNKKVLIIEENPKHARALSYFLEEFGIAATMADSLSSGVEQLRSSDVNCVILDMGIPNATAYQTLERVKDQIGVDHLPIIIFTGKSLSKTDESRIRQFADSIVVKTANSFKRILDEVTLFLHLVEQQDRKPAAGAGTGNTLAKDVLQGKKVLVADDDVRNIFSLTRILESHGINVISAIDGREAIKILEDNPDTDVVLMDIMMPEMDGYEAMREIRSRFAFRDLPIIAVTAKAMTGDREKCVAAGASDYITKPVDTDQLISLLRVWIYDRNF